MTPDQIRMFDRLLRAHELGQKLAPRVLSHARRMLAKALQPLPITHDQDVEQRL